VTGGRKWPVNVAPQIGAGRTLGHRAHPTAPIITFGQTPPPLTDDRNLDSAHIVDEGFAKAIKVWHLGVWADPDALVDDSTKMFGEVSVQVGRNCSERLVKKYLDA